MQLSVLCKMCIKCNRVSCAIHVVRLAHYHLFTSVTASCLEISSALNASSVLARLKTAFSSNVTAALVRWVPTVISDGNSHLTARWIFFDSFWLGPTLFRSQTLPGIARVTTEDEMIRWDETCGGVFPPAELSSGGDRISDRTGNGLFSLLFGCNRNRFGLNSIRG